MSRDDAIATLLQEVERRQEEIEAIEQAIAVLGGGAPTPLALSRTDRLLAMLEGAPEGGCVSSELLLAEIFEGNKPALHQCVFGLRQSLRQRGADIEHVKGEGYRMTESRT